MMGFSGMYVILKGPYDVMWSLYLNTEWSSLPEKEWNAIYGLPFRISVLSYSSNYAFEFIVYFVNGRKFREAFLETFLPCRKANNRNGRRANERRNINAGTTSSV